MGRPSLAAMVLAVGLVTAACSGGDDESADPDVAGPSPATDAVTTVPETTVAVTVTTAATTTTIAATTVVTTTAATTPTTVPSAAPAPTPPEPGGGYEPVDAPTFPTRTAVPPAGSLPDGSYYAVASGATGDGGPRLTVVLYELLTGPDAIAAAQADGVGLDSDIYIRPQGSVTEDLELTPDQVLSVARPDRPAVSYRVAIDELIRLVGGGSPSSDAPDGYRYVPFPYLITVEGGRPTRIEQLWAP